MRAQAATLPLPLTALTIRLVLQRLHLQLVFLLDHVLFGLIVLYRIIRERFFIQSHASLVTILLRTERLFGGLGAFLVGGGGLFDVRVGALAHGLSRVIRLGLVLLPLLIPATHLLLRL